MFRNLFKKKTGTKEINRNNEQLIREIKIMTKKFYTVDAKIAAIRRSNEVIYDMKVARALDEVEAEFEDIKWSIDYIERKLKIEDN